MHTNSMEESAAWGAGYDAGQEGLLKTIETAELLERNRIIKLLEPFFDKAENAETRRLLIMAIALIKGENK